MRIIAGAWRGRRLKGLGSLKGLRPTSDRAREALFNILGARVTEGPFIDLFAGTGAVGLEAASRGAPQVVLVEQSAGASALCQANIELLQAEQVELRRASALAPGPLPAAQVAFADPPYEMPLLTAVKALLACPVLPGGCWVLERRSSESLVQLPDGVAVASDRVYGEARILILEEAL